MEPETLTFEPAVSVSDGVVGALESTLTTALAELVPWLPTLSLIR